MPSRILLTGRPGTGKTTIVREVLETGIPLAGGFVTAEMRKAGRRVGFAIEDVYTHTQGTLANVQCHGPARIGRYGLNIDDFERVGVAALLDALKRDGCIVIDEIGKMELLSKPFQDAVMEVVDSDHPLLATIPLHSHPLLNTLRKRPDVTLIEVTPTNRDELPRTIAELLVQPATNC